jgi:hypothetical protein
MRVNQSVKARRVCSKGYFSDRRVRMRSSKEKHVQGHIEALKLRLILHPLCLLDAVKKETVDCARLTLPFFSSAYGFQSSLASEWRPAGGSSTAAWVRRASFGSGVLTRATLEAHFLLQTTESAAMVLQSEDFQL